MKKIFILFFLALLSIEVYPRRDKGDKEFFLSGQIGVIITPATTSANSDYWETIAGAYSYWDDAVMPSPSMDFNNVNYQIGGGINYFLTNGIAYSFSINYDKRNYKFVWEERGDYTNVEDIVVRYKNIKYLTFTSGLKICFDTSYYDNTDAVLLGLGIYYSILLSKKYDLEIKGKIVNPISISKESMDGSGVLKNDLGIYIDVGYILYVSQENDIEFVYRMWFGTGSKVIDTENSIINEARTMGMFLLVNLLF